MQGSSKWSRFAIPRRRVECEQRGEDPDDTQGWFEATIRVYWMLGALATIYFASVIGVYGAYCLYEIQRQSLLVEQ